MKRAERPNRILDESGTEFCGVLECEGNLLLEDRLAADTRPSNSRFTEWIQLYPAGGIVLTHDQVHQRVIQGAAFEARVYAAEIAGPSFELPHVVKEITGIGVFADERGERGTRGVYIDEGQRQVFKGGSLRERLVGVVSDSGNDGRSWIQWRRRRGGGLDAACPIAFRVGTPPECVRAVIAVVGKRDEVAVAIVITYAGRGSGLAVAVVVDVVSRSRARLQ